LGLLLCVHIFACGWYLCAALHYDNWEQTWLADRTVDNAGTWVAHADSGTQWIHSMYFVLTVFTTVGFGDIGPRTNAEIAYVFFLMMIGAVVNSIIVSGMISILTDIDEASKSLRDKKQLVEAFANHAKLDFDILGQLRSWLHARHKETSCFDSKLMRQLLLDAGGIPRELLSILPGALFKGAVVNNAFVQVCLSANARRAIPPRFPLLLALELSEHRYQHHEVVYHAHDHAFNLFLVTQGTFAYIAQPTAAGGQAEMLRTSPRTPRPATPISQQSSKLSLMGRVVGRTGVDKHCAAHGRTCVIPNTNKLYPFQLFSSRAYCGDIELFSGQTRHSSLRNETTDPEDRPSDGVMLVMSKSELENLLNEFPHYQAIWKEQADRRAHLRKCLCKRMNQGRHYKDLAATTIQRRLLFYQQVKRSRKVATPSNDGEWNDETGAHASAFGHLHQLRAANSCRSMCAPKPGSVQTDLGALHHEVQMQGKQLQQALEGINVLLQHQKRCSSPLR
jgi:hypothetical protein